MMQYNESDLNNYYLRNDNNENNSQDYDETPADEKNENVNQKIILIKQINNLISIKLKCREEIGNLFSGFIENDFKPIIQQLRDDVDPIFKDYISHPKAKLRYNNDEVNDAIQSLEREIKEISEKSLEEVEIKLENLKASISAIIHEINKSLFKAKAQFDKVYLSGSINGDKIVRLEEVAEPMALGFGLGGSGIGALIGIGIAKGVGETIGAGLLFGGAFGIASAGIGLVLGFVGFGVYKLYKVTHKEEDLVELTQKGRKSFFEKINIYYDKVETQLNDYKEKVIKEIQSIIEKGVAKLNIEKDNIDERSQF